ncbi:aldo/keto reductase [Halomicrococcus sp. NG-SE-24]|uniref:aldo/keto reductase n=1 Tax=Halomicrococcus sp. NG-SE-24 TaxID=3436928 RepID=UPI003D98134B
MRGANIPRLGYGTYDVRGETGAESVATAIDVGYRHVDTARMYENEDVVGEGIRRSGIDRDDLFVATKFGHFTEPEPTPEYVRAAVAESREALGVDAIDLLYVHWPTHDYDPEVVFPVMNDLRDDGAIRHLGVSNFTVDHLRDALAVSDAPILANQVEMHPLLQQEELLDFLGDRDMTLVAYSPLAQGNVFDVPVLREIAAKHGVSEARVSLAWLLSKENVVPIPKATSEEHVRDNYAALDLELDDEDVARIEGIDRTMRLESPDFMW